MGYFDWIFKYRFDSERATLLDMLTHTMGWYNELTGPLMPLLQDFEFGRRPQDVELYRNIAKSIYEIKVMAGHGDSLINVLQSMNPRGIPFFTPRKRLVQLANEFHERGLFVKEVAMSLYGWVEKSEKDQEHTRASVFENWKEFECAKDNLIEEINGQLRKLG